MARIYRVVAESKLSFFIRAENEEDALSKCGEEFMEHVAGSADFLTEATDSWNDEDPAIEQHPDWVGIDFDLVDDD